MSLSALPAPLCVPLQWLGINPPPLFYLLPCCFSLYIHLPLSPLIPPLSFLLKHPLPDIFLFPFYIIGQHLERMPGRPCLPATKTLEFYFLFFILFFIFINSQL